MRELVHESIAAGPDDWIRLQFPGRRFIEVLVISWSRESMIVNDGSGLVEFESVEIPFNLNDERMGQVSGKLKAWKIKNFPDSAPCMIVSNMGSEWRIP